MEYIEIFRAELKVDVYGGKNCDEHNKYWNAYAEGDQDSENFTDSIEFRLENLPIGAKISIIAPVCPNCGCIQEDCGCGFNWKKWVENKYS